jgi:putative colanic acid biosynthesis acetyltransferase WcaF
MAPDPYLVDAFPLRNRVARLLWALGYYLLFRLSPRPFFGWRVTVLRLFGGQLGADCKIYPSCRIWAPWNLVCEDVVAIAEGSEIYNPALVTLKSHAIISQGAYLCGATHKHDDPSFRLVARPITVGAYAWICARANVSPGVEVGEGAVLGMASLATRNLEPWGVYGGVPARRIGSRRRQGPTSELES